MQNQILAIKVVPGTYGNFMLKNRSLVEDGRVQSVFERIKENSPLVHQEGIERAMLIVSDMPGASLPTLTIAPGSAPGTSDFLVQMEPADRVHGYVVADNYGSRLTGKDRLSAGVDVYSPFGIADRLTFSGMSSESSGLQNARVAYGVPLSPNGLRVEVAAAKTTYKLGDEYKDLDASGTANTLDATFSYPLIRSREDSLYLFLNVANKRLRDDIDATSTSTAKRASVATVTLQREIFGKVFGSNASINMSSGFTFGHLSFDDDEQKAENRAGADTVGNYSKINLAFNGRFALVNNWSLLANAQLQKALGKNLDSSEQFTISGANGIKSYADGVTSDNGYLLGAELKYAFAPINGIDQATGLFANYGEVRPEDGSYTTVGKISISDVGLAYYVSNKTLFSRLQVSRTLGTQDDTKEYNHKTGVLLQVGMRL